MTPKRKLVSLSNQTWTRGKEREATMGRPYDPDVFLGYGERCVEDDHDGQIAALERDLQAAQARIAEVEAERDAAEDEGIAGRRGQNEAEVERDAALAKLQALREAVVEYEDYIGLYCDCAAIHDDNCPNARLRLLLAGGDDG